MKNTTICALLLSFLLQSCYSYKNINLKDTRLVEGKKYKIEQDNKWVKTKLLTINDSIANFKIDKNEKEISISEIQEIKIRKFDAVKTASITVLPILIVVLITNQLSESLNWNYNPSGNTNPI